MIHGRLLGQAGFLRFLASTRKYKADRCVHGNYANCESTASNALDPSYEGDTRVKNLVNAYRRFGYLQAELDPLGLWRTGDESGFVDELRPELYGLDLEVCGKESLTTEGQATISDLVAHLRRTYCASMAVEFMHLQNTQERQWFASQFEQLMNSHEVDVKEKLKAHELMLRSKCWERFLATKFPTLKRYSGEGSEAAVAFYARLMEESPSHGIREFIFEGAHRGKLALLNVLFRYPAAQMFRKIRGKEEFPADVQGSGDVLTHQTSSFDYEPKDGGPVMHVSVLPNPSHLEVSLPMALGKARARAQSLRLGDYDQGGAGRCGDGVLCVHHHGDGAFTGQGVVWESLSLSQVPHFRVGGSIHLVVNNQVAFTAERRIGRSSLHCTDIAKGIDSPVIHVNGDCVEDMIRAAQLALAYRQHYRKDVFVNMLCYRRHGHNELDDPSFTQPRMYSAIDAHESVVDSFGRQLTSEGSLNTEAVERVTKECTDELERDLKEVDEGSAKPVAAHLEGNWSGLVQAPSRVERWDSGVDVEWLRYIGAASVRVPSGFNLHPHLQKTHVDARLKRLKSGDALDWSCAEALAFGSLLMQGFDVRLSGQDVGRATFSHRHAMLVDQRTDAVHIPLNHISAEQRNFIELANSPLAEEAIVGFEYGFSIESPRRLVIWEAQFGDFYNGAQVQIDQLVASGESKWLTQSGLVLMLPHGFDGAGPDHSSAHVERFLQLVDSRESQHPLDGQNVNMVVANPTTSAQYFHLLRRQVLTPYRKPLILLSPKFLLRHPAASSPLEEFAPGTHFKPVLLDVDSLTGADKVRRLVFTSGKHSIHLANEIKQRGIDDMAIVRMECLCPFPAEELGETISQFPNMREMIWSQEESGNAGCWGFIAPRFWNALGIKLRYNGRPELPWMATAIAERHRDEGEQILRDLFSKAS